MVLNTLQTTAEQSHSSSTMRGSSSSSISSSSSSSLSKQEQLMRLYTPMVLTRAVIPSLVTGLDASDVLECYYLTRRTVLHGISNNTITITKAALGLRQRFDPRSSQSRASSPTREKKRPLSLTLEFGPARMVDESIPVWQEPIWRHYHESIPRVVYENNNNNNPTLVSWENEGRVYYSTHIDAEEYPTANYLASVSGAVLNRLLTVALSYTTNAPQAQRHRRYQPFSVYYYNNNNNDKNTQPPPPHGGADHDGTHNDNQKNTPPPLLPPAEPIFASSSDVDFILYLYQNLAQMGVALQPVLRPKHQQVRLHAKSKEDWKLVQVGHDVSMTDVALFYSRFMTCVQAIATADYSAYNNADNNNNNNNRVTPMSEAPSGAPVTNRGGDRFLMTTTTETNTTTVNTTTANGTTTVVQTSIESFPNATAATNNTTLDSSTTASGSTTHSTTTSSSSSLSVTPTAAPTGNPTLARTESEQASQAAAVAQEAANQANLSGNTQAAEAAQAAADAAQRAADLTVSQQASMHKEALHSGEPNVMAATVALCLSNPLYGLVDSASDPADGTTVYLYWDGTFYVKVKLVAPYVSVGPLQYQLPLPYRLHDHAIGGGTTQSSGGGGFVDFLVALSIVLFFALGVLLLVQKLFGRNFRIIRPLYRYQRWFFDPTRYDLQTMDDESEACKVAERHGGGAAWNFAFGEDVIPISMGGRRSAQLSPSRRRAVSREFTTLEASGIMSNSYGGGGGINGGEIEMFTARRNGTGSRKSSFDSDGGAALSDIGGGGVSLDDMIAEHILETSGMSGGEARLFRDPDLVDLPNLTSTSKVAVPVSLANTSTHSHGGSLDELY